MVKNVRPYQADNEEQMRRPIRLPRSESRLDVQEALVVLRRRKWSIVAITLLVVLAALFLSSRQTPVYESEARVLVMPNNAGVSSASGTQGTGEHPNLATEAELMSSVAVAKIVAKDLGISGNPRSLLDDVSVEWPTDTQILQVGYRHSDPAEARRRAQGFAEGYLQYRTETATEELKKSAEVIQKELAVLQQQLKKVERNLARISDSDPNRGGLENRRALLQNLILERQLDQLRLPPEVEVGRIFQPAPLPSSPVSPNHVLNGGLGLLAGLAFGIGLAFLRDRLSGRLRSEEVENYLRAPVLGSIPHVPEWRRRKKAFLVTVTRWRSPAAEAYRILRTNVLSTASAYEAKSILVTSAKGGQGKSATVANLGVVLARAGKRVSLVSADLRQPRLHEFFRTGVRAGLTDVLAGYVSLDDALQEIRWPPPPTSHTTAVDLRLLQSGHIPQDPAEVLSTTTMTMLLSSLEKTSDIVLIDVPPILSVTDALVLAPVVQGILLVIGPSGNTKSSVIAARQWLDKVGARILGTVLNDQDSTGRA